MKPFNISILMSIVALGLISGCTLKTMDKPEVIVQRETPDLIYYQLKAMECEKNNELQLALLNLRISETLLYEKIADLTDRIDNNAEKYFQKGVTFFNKGELVNARNEFLKTLRYDRNHEDALKFLKGWLNTPRNIACVVKDGDTFEAIAGRVYKNKRNDFLVKYFSGLEHDSDLKQGEIILLPILETSFTKQFFNFNKKMNYARKLYTAKDYENLLPVAQNILKHVPDSEEALYMVNSSYYGLGERYFHEGRYSDSVSMLNQVDPRFRNVKKIIRKINKAKDKMLADETENKNNECYHAGRQLFRNGEYIKALATLRQVSPDYADVGEIITRLLSVMKQKSELHYREGVKYFVNEDLQKAINEWRIALSLDPDNEKIKKDIHNAEMLLKKIKSLD